MKIVRWGIIGTGKIANKFAQAVQNADGAKLVAVASRTEESAKAFAEKHHIPYALVGYESLAKFADVDAIYIGLPHTYHPIYAKLFMEAGKHVLSEKPICINNRQLKELQKIQKEQNVYLMEAMWTRFLPAILQLRKMLKEGIIGQVLEVSADFCYRKTDKESGTVYKKEYAGGSLLDVGIYGLNFASIVLGDDVETVQSAVHTASGIDERTHILLTYENGAIARISSAVALEKPEDAYVYGTEGYVHIPHFYAASEFTVVTAQGKQEFCFPYKGNGFEEEIEECNRCIAAGQTQSTVMPLTQSEKILQMMDKVRKQAGVEYDAD